MLTLSSMENLIVPCKLKYTHAPASVVVRRTSYVVVVVHNFKHLLLRNRLPDQSQILCGASLGRGNESLFAASGSHDQDGCHAHIWYKLFKNILLQNRQDDFHET